MKVRTLIADDESLARDRLRQLLADQPEIELVGECADGREAVTEIQNKSPDLIFLDIQMPELDGFAVLEAINIEPMPIIVFATRTRCARSRQSATPRLRFRSCRE